MIVCAKCNRVQATQPEETSGMTIIEAQMIGWKAEGKSRDKYGRVGFLGIEWICPDCFKAGTQQPSSSETSERSANA